MVETVVTVERTQTTQPAAPPTGGGLSALRINIGYFQTVPGIIKIIQFVLGIICMACASPAYISATHFFLFVVVVSFIATLLWIFAYLLGIREALNVAVNWIFTEFLATAISSILYLIAFIVQLTGWAAIPSERGYGSNMAAGVFGLFTFLAYMELLNTGFAALLYFIAFVVQLAKWTSYPHAYAHGSNIAAGVFGCFNFVAYAAGTYFLFLEHRSGATY